MVYGLDDAKIKGKYMKLPKVTDADRAIIKGQVERDVEVVFGTEGFCGHAISWLPGKDILEKIYNIGIYIMSFLDEDYANEVFQNFFDEMKSYVQDEGKVTFETLDKVIMNIRSISSEDLSEAKKQELIIKAYEKVHGKVPDSEELHELKQELHTKESRKKAEEDEEWSDEKYELTENDHVILGTYDMKENQEDFNNSVNKTPNEDYSNVLNYFDLEQSRISMIFNKETLIPNKVVENNISTEQGLKEFVTQEVKKFITNFGNSRDMMEANLKNVIKFLDNEKNIQFSPKEKEKLIAIAEAPLLKFQERDIKQVARHARDVLKSIALKKEAISERRN